ncbi:MAG: hypothetical protein JWN85_806 [Gammaproteobacteria bacterium]|nr:hypothetical protein [Gammaproteobacteria bacterium]
MHSERQLRFFSCLRALGRRAAGRMMGRPYHMACALLMLNGVHSYAQAPLHPGFDVTNSSGVGITAVYAKPAGSPVWGSPLPGGRIAAGATQSVVVPSETNCSYDVRLVFENGRTELRGGVDVCKHVRVEVQAAPANPR